MVDPVTLGVGAAVAGGVGGIIQGIGAKGAADAQASANKYKAGVALLNKQINDQNASWSLEEGGAKSEQSGLKAGQEIAQTKVAQAASGFDVNSGTGAAVRDNQTKVAEYDQNVINWNASKTAWGFETKATMDVAESNLDLASASNESEAGTISEIGSFIGAAGSVAGKWYQGKSIGLS